MNSAQSPEDRIAILERKWKRERKARELAEKQLEEYSRQIYSTNVSLQTSLKHAEKKQSQLEFLGQVSANVNSDKAIGELFEYTIELIGSFVEAECGFYCYAEQGKLIKDQPYLIWFDEGGWGTNQYIIDAAFRILPTEHTEEFSHWLVAPVDDLTETVLVQFHWMFFVNFKLNDNRMLWMTFFTRHEPLDEEMLFVIDTARRHLESGIRRRTSEIQILARNKELQRIADSLRETRRQLVQSEKMASLGQLAAGVAHEINNPISFIRSNSEVMSDYLLSLGKVFEWFEEQVSNKTPLTLTQWEEFKVSHDMDFILNDCEKIIEANLDGTNRISEIVDSLKTFSHSGKETLQPVNLVDCINSALKMTENSLKYDIVVDVDYPSEVEEVSGNASQLQQVFVNLILNAKDAMEGGGRLTIEVLRQPEGLQVLLKDDGQGMSQEVLDNLFTPFFTTKPVGVGTGLGLSISYAILQNHDVAIQVDSKEGIGTTFTLTFPSTSHVVQ